MGAVSGNPNNATMPITTPQNMYQAGASGLPVALMSHATKNCALPPNTEIASA